MLSLLCLALALTGQVGELFKGFKLPYYESASGKNPKSFLKSQFTGGEARMLSNGLVSVTKGVRIEDLLADGKTNLIATAPQCVVDSKSRVAYSTSRLEVETANGQLTIQGEGFFYQQTNFSLTLSNRVETTIHRELLRSTNAGPGSFPPLAKGEGRPGSNDVIKIFSDHFNLESPANLATYSGHVRVEDPQMELSCETLTIRRSTEGRVESIVADQSVAITNRLDNSRATGDRAVYSLEPGQELVVLTGQPARWDDGERAGQAGVYTFDRRANTVQAGQEPSLRLPRALLGQPDWLAGSSASPANAPGVPNQFVDVTAAEMTIQLPTTNQPSRRIVVRTNVVILSAADQGRATSEQAVYEEATGTLELTGKAVWQSDQRVVKGETLLFDRTNQVLRARRNTYLKAPLSALGRQAPVAPDLKPAATPLETVEVFSEDFIYQPAALIFQENVRANYYQGEVRHGGLTCGFLSIGFNRNRIETVVAKTRVALEMPAVGTNGARRVDKTLRCENLSIDFYTNGLVRSVLAESNVLAQQTETRLGHLVPITTRLTASRASASFFAHTNQVREMVAEKNVTIVQDAKSARGDRAVFSATNNLVQLMGNPTADTPMGRITQAEVLIWDRTHNTLKAKGRKVLGEGEAPGKGTNRGGLRTPFISSARHPHNDRD